MNAPARATLYSRDLLALAVELARYPHDAAAPLRAELRSRTCGSTLHLSARNDGTGGLRDIGLRVAACAVGQAASAIFAASAKGCSRADLAAAEHAVAAWLRGECARPAWPRLELLDSARAFPGRHEAILLPWRAALAALSNQPAEG